MLEIKTLKPLILTVTLATFWGCSKPGPTGEVVSETSGSTKVEEESITTEDIEAETQDDPRLVILQEGEIEGDLEQEDLEADLEAEISDQQDETEEQIVRPSAPVYNESRIEITGELKVNFEYRTVRRINGDGTLAPVEHRRYGRYSRRSQPKLTLNFFGNFGTGSRKINSSAREIGPSRNNVDDMYFIKKEDKFFIKEVIGETQSVRDYEVEFYAGNYEEFLQGKNVEVKFSVDGKRTYLERQKDVLKAEIMRSFGRTYNAYEVIIESMNISRDHKFRINGGRIIIDDLRFEIKAILQ